MSQFLILIHESESEWAAADEAVSAEVMAGHRAVAAKYGAALLGGEALQPSDTAKVVRDGIVTDGPFLETKEALGGYYLVEAADLDAAVEIAKDVPARFGCIEVRPVMVFD